MVFKFLKCNPGSDLGVFLCLDTISRTSGFICMTRKIITLPTSLNDIPLKDYIKFTEIQKENPEDSEFLEIKMLEIFAGVNGRDSIKMRASDRRKLVLRLVSVLNKKPSIVRLFEYSGVKYGFVPNLDDITFGELIDLDNYIKNPKTLPEVMSILFRPVSKTLGDRYQIDPYNGASNVLSGMPTDIALGALGFFLSLGLDLLKYTRKYSADQSRVRNRSSRGSARSGAGFNLFIRSLEATLSALKRSLDYPFTSVYIGLLSRSTNQGSKNG